MARERCKASDRSEVEFQGYRIEQIGRKGRSTSTDIYHFLLASSWTRVFAILVGVYLAANVVFATLFLLVPGSLLNAREGSFGDAFFFSIDTMTTIGYGSILPDNLYAQVLAMVDVMFGLIWVALATGLMFAKISLPSAKVMFSDKMVICRRDGLPVLMMRVANTRDTAVIEARIRMDLMLTERTAEGQVLRRLYPLAMVQDVSPMFVLTWSGVHAINEDSPLYQMTPEQLQGGNARISVIVSGMDSALMQTVIAQHVYSAGEVCWNRNFVDIITPGTENRIRVDYTRFSEVREATDAERIDLESLTGNARLDVYDFDAEAAGRTAALAAADPQHDRAGQRAGQPPDQP